MRGAAVVACATVFFLEAVWLDVAIDGDGSPSTERL